MKQEELHSFAERFLDAWNTQDVERVVAVDGMDLVVVEGERIKPNEVYFDRSVLAPLLAEQAKAA